MPDMAKMAELMMGMKEIVNQMEMLMQGGEQEEKEEVGEEQTGSGGGGLMNRMANKRIA